MINYKKMSNQWYEWRYGEKELTEETISEHTVTFSKEDMKTLHNSGTIIKKDPDGKEHTYTYKDSTDEGFADKFAKNVSKYNKKTQKSRDTLKKYAKVKKK
tara:strand:- start:332 stop:634 length:303 start_codon:yes stop_codon:yes gene_type:complete